MLNHSIYRQQAEKNEITAKAAKDGFPDCAVIMCFYAALHWVNDYAFRNNEMTELNPTFYGYETSNHEARKKYVKRIARQRRYIKLETAYKNLFDESMKARYLKELENENCTAREHYLEIGIQFCFDYLDQVKKGLL